MSSENSFDSVEAAIGYLRSSLDDMDSIEMRVASNRSSVGRDYVTGSYATIKLCSGKSQVITLDIAEGLINEGWLCSLSIPVRLLPAPKNEALG